MSLSIFNHQRTIIFHHNEDEYESQWDILFELDILKIRKQIPHNRGKFEANEDGELLCNGHCNWYECVFADHPIVCQNCGYLECWNCGEEFLAGIDNIYPEIEGLGLDFCRNCL